MATKSELEIEMKEYIDSRRDGHQLRELLNNESADNRYCLLINVRRKFSAWTGAYRAAYNNDLESIRYMLDGFPSNKKYDVLKIQSSNGSTPLHTAAYYGYSSIITYLMTDLSQQQMYDLLKIQDNAGDTALHHAASNNRVKAYRVIFASVPYHLLVGLFNIKNNNGISAADIRPKLNEEFPLSIAHDMI